MKHEDGYFISEGLDIKGLSLSYVIYHYTMINAIYDHHLGPVWKQDRLQRPSHCDDPTDRYQFERFTGAKVS